MTMSDEFFMRQALKEARRGLGQTSPNPAVGCVIVRKGKVAARGWHRAAGKPHAEIEALRQLPSARGCDVFITLEPCSTEGRTPPCTDALIKSGARRVIYGATDPNPRHRGRARRLLTKAGIEVVAGILADECAALNEGWNHWIVTGMPFVIAKCGMSLDGRIDSPPGQRWLTGESSRRDAMKLRARVDAILVGAETVRTDNPHLTLRGIKGRQPLRVVWSRHGNLPPDCHLLTDEWRERTHIYQGKGLRAVLQDLGKRGITQVLIEGGGQTLGAALDQRLIHRVEIYLAPILTGGKIPAFGGRGVGGNVAALGLIDPLYRKIGTDLKISARIQD